MDYKQTLNEIVNRLHKLGDLPVFSATVNQIRQLSSSEEADAMALAMAVMKDVNLSVRVLKLANTPMFNPKNREIASLSRAVVLLGFERILNLAMTIKLVESLRAEKPDKVLDQLLVQAFLNASIARELAEAANLRKAEGVYLNGLLHNLGEILVAYTLPDRHKQLRDLWLKGEAGWSEAQLQLLGAEFSDIGQEFAESWGFPGPLVQSMDSYTANKLKGRDKSAHQIAVGSSEVLAKLYQQGRESGESLGQIFSRLSDQLDIRTDQVEESVHQAYKLAAHLAEEVGVPTAFLKPKPADEDDDQLQELAEEVGFYLHSRDEKHRAEVIHSPAPAVSQRSSVDLIEALAAFNSLIAEDTPATPLVEALMRAVLANSGLERSLFLMKDSNQKGVFIPRLAAGVGVQALGAKLDRLNDSTTSRLLQAVAQKGTTLMVNDLSSAQWRDRLPTELVKSTEARGLILSGLSVNGRSLGVLYFDTQLEALADTDYAILNQFMLLLRNALEARARASS